MAEGKRAGARVRAQASIILAEEGSTGYELAATDWARAFLATVAAEEASIDPELPQGREASAE